MANTQKNKHKSRIRKRKSRRELGSRMYKNYSEEMLKLACETVQSGQFSSRDAQRQFGIPRRTIINKIKKVHTKSVGHPTALTAEEEHKIVKVLQASSNFGSPLTKIPDSLSKQCISVINSCLGKSLRINTATSAPTDLSHLKASTSSTTNISRARKDDKNSVQNSPAKKNKIVILSNVLLKAGAPRTDVAFLKKASGKTENTPFTATHKTDLPECLQEKKNKQTKKVKKEHTRKFKKIKRKGDVENNSKGKKAARAHTSSVKRRNKRYDSVSSSISAGNEVITVDTDDSEYETINDYFIAESLREQEEKENFDSTNSIIPFGLHDIEYFSENQEKLKENDWIIAQFRTKKCLKHFVGKVLSIDGVNPIIKYVRKVKESKCDTGATFTYPKVDDVCTMHNLDDVVTVLPEPTITRRGQIVFKVDFSNFNIQ